MANSVNQELPYAELAKLGLSQEMVQALPPEVLDRLKAGELTPLVFLHFNNGNHTYTVPTKLQWVRQGNSDAYLLTYPVRSQPLESKLFTPEEADRLSRGDIISKKIPEIDKNLSYLIQLDPETNHYLCENKARVLQKNLADVEKINHIQLGTEQKKQIREGKPVELDVGGEKMVMDVDLREPKNFKVFNGAFDKYESERLKKYDEEHPEVMGYVQTDKNRWEFIQFHLEMKRRHLQKDSKLKKELEETVKMKFK